MSKKRKPGEQMERASCIRFLSYGYDRTPKQTLEELAAYAAPDEPSDDFGCGPMHDRLETRLCSLLGTEAAMFLPSGRSAQLIALRILCSRAGSDNVAMHPRSHLEELENKAFSHVFGLRSIPIGRMDSRLSPTDLDRLAEKAGAATIELPHLALGCQAPPWDELVEISARLRARGVALHVDAARLWEVQPYYARPHAEIAHLFTSLYVSFYKGFSAMAGGALCGPKWMIDEARIWAHRLGATPRQMYPLVLDALRCMDIALPRMALYHTRACELAEAFGDIPGLFVTPRPPHSNTFRVALPGTAKSVRAAARTIAAETGVWLVDHMPECAIQGLSVFQVVVADSTLDIPVAEARDLVTRLARAA